MTSNGDGLIRLEGFSPGTCRVTFPDLDYRDVSSPKPAPSSAHGSELTPHNVKQGETASSLARQHGFFQFKTVWNASENADLQKARKDPHVLRPGDVVHIPKRTAPEFSLASGKQHIISIHQSKVSARLTLLDWLGEPRKSESVVVEGERETVRTDHDGKLTFVVADHVQHATLRCKGEEMKLRIGHLDPGTTLDGVSARLRNLGFYPDGADDDDRLRFALELFVDHAKDSPTPKGNEALAEKLRSEHGS